MSLITGTDVVKEYETGGETVRALEGIDFAVDRGEFVSIVGPSGSGKSTLLNILGLLDTPTRGTVRVDGADVSEMTARERTDRRSETIGFVFQSFFLVPTLTARENVEVPRLLAGEPDETTRRATELLERVGLGDRTDHFPDELSGGQKQRVAIARSLINDPDLLLADEPTGNLDRDTGDVILEEFGRICGDDVAVVTVTHDDYVADYADGIVELIDGAVVSGREPTGASASDDAGSSEESDSSSEAEPSEDDEASDESEASGDAEPAEESKPSGASESSDAPEGSGGDADV